MSATLIVGDAVEWTEIDRDYSPQRPPYRVRVGTLISQNPHPSADARIVEAGTNAIYDVPNRLVKLGNPQQRDMIERRAGLPPLEPPPAPR